jgi:hypothetical protein
MPALAADMPAIVCCQPHKPAERREWWSFREVDGKACWYAGRPGKPKSELRWCSSVTPVHPPEAASELNKSPPADVDSGAVPEIVEGSFEDRWRGLEGCREDARISDCRPIKKEGE